MIKCDKGMVSINGEFLVVKAEISTLINSIKEDLVKNGVEDDFVDAEILDAVDKGLHPEKVMGIEGEAELIELLKKPVGDMDEEH